MEASFRRALPWLRAERAGGRAGRREGKLVVGSRAGFGRAAVNPGGFEHFAVGAFWSKALGGLGLGSSGRRKGREGEGMRERRRDEKGEREGRRSEREREGWRKMEGGQKRRKERRREGERKKE